MKIDELLKNIDLEVIKLEADQKLFIQVDCGTLTNKDMVLLCARLRECLEGRDITNYIINPVRGQSGRLDIQTLCRDCHRVECELQRRHKLSEYTKEETLQNAPDFIVRAD